MKKWIIIAGILLLGLLWALLERRTLFMHYFAAAGAGKPPALLEKADEGPAVEWMDDYFTIELIAPATYAIGEPRYAQQNYNYLIIGADRALLFDAGPGIRDVRRAAQLLTQKPIVFLPSHFHYDHVGNEITFDEIAVVDLPYIRQRVRDGQLTLLPMEHLGATEGFDAPTWQVDHWWAPGDMIDLGGRSLQLFYTPGHTADSVSLWDEDNGIVFSGDYIYPGPLYGFLPGSSMGDYLSAADMLLDALPQDVTFFGAHRSVPPGAPRLGRVDLEDLKAGLEGMKNGSVEGVGGYPRQFPINDKVIMLAEPRWLQSWE